MESCARRKSKTDIKADIFGIDLVRNDVGWQVGSNKNWVLILILTVRLKMYRIRLTESTHTTIQQ